MTLDDAECWRRLRRSRHGVLAFGHPERGADAVPVVFAVRRDGAIVLPVDTVKPKSSTRLARLESLSRDPRCVLLVDRYSADWSRLWWVRVHGRAHVIEDGVDEVVSALRSRYPAYREPGTIVAAVVLSPVRVQGWSADGQRPSRSARRSSASSGSVPGP